METQSKCRSSVCTGLQSFASQMSCCSIQPSQLSIFNNNDSLKSLNNYIERIRNQIDQKDNIILNLYENVVHILDSCSLISNVCKTSDKELFEKSFLYFNESLVHFVSTLHQYPVDDKFIDKKRCLKNRHLNILKQIQQNSIDNSRVQNVVENQNNILISLNQQLTKRNQQLEFTLAKMQKQLIKFQINSLKQIHKNTQNKPHLISIQQLQNAKNQIQKMNTEFTLEIKKYNQVFRSMEKDIQLLQQNPQTNSQNYIEELETQIIKMREQRQRDSMIISQLKDIRRIRNQYGGKSSSRKMINTYY